jgi:hypothetical protein
VLELFKLGVVLLTVQNRYVVDVEEKEETVAREQAVNTRDQM